MSFFHGSNYGDSKGGPKFKDDLRNLRAFTQILRSISQRRSSPLEKNQRFT